MKKDNESYNYISSKIKALKDATPSLREKSDEYVFSALAVKCDFFKNPALQYTEKEIEDAVVDGQYDGGVDILLNIPNNEATDLIIGQSKYYSDITFDTVFNAFAKMISFYQEMQNGHYESVNQKVQKRFLDLYSNIGEESTVHFTFYTSASQNKSIKQKLQRKIESTFSLTHNICLDIYFGDDIVETIKEFESRRPSVEHGKIKIDKSNNYLEYNNAAIVNVSAFSIKELYAKNNINLLSKNLRYHISNREIDKAIENSIIESPDQFWFKNNGITIICDDYRIDGKEVKLSNFSIINGGQTTYMIHKSNVISEIQDFYLPCKIIRVIGETDNDKANFILEIAKATNSQKPIKKIDLKSNAPEQIRFSQEIREEGIFYQTKRGETIPKDFKLPYKNSDLAEIGKLALAGIFQLPGTSRNKPSKLYENPFYDTVFNNSQKIVPHLCRELLYIDYYFKNDFIKKYDSEIADSPTTNEQTLPFAHNARTLCLSFVVLASRYFYGSIDNTAIAKLINAYKSDDKKLDMIDSFSNIKKMKFIFPNSLFSDKDQYDNILYKLFHLIIKEGFSTYRMTAKYEEINATNFLKKDSSYYMILEDRWDSLSEDIPKILEDYKQ